MNTDDKTIKLTELIINALEYAHSHNLDIDKKDDVKKILEALDPENANGLKVEEFIKNLQDANTLMEMTARKKSNKTNLPN